jgi:hypothetical protein
MALILTMLTRRSYGGRRPEHIAKTIDTEPDSTPSEWSFSTTPKVPLWPRGAAGLPMP